MPLTITAIYIVLGVGIVIGAASVLAVLVWRKALAERERERYFSDVRALSRRKGLIGRVLTRTKTGMPSDRYTGGHASRHRSLGAGAS